MSSDKDAQAVKKATAAHRWLVSYADILTLLLALFIVLYGISAPNEGQYKQVSSSLSQAFTRKINTKDNSSEDSPGDISFVMDDSILEGYQEIFENWETQSKQSRNFSNMAFDLETTLVDALEDFQVQISVDEDWIEISLSSDIIFSPGSSYVNYIAEQAIEKIAILFKGNTYNIHIEGHTDDRPISNILYPTNWELSSARATSVLRVLEDMGIESNRLVASGFGSQYPVAQNDTAQGRAKNRRVVFIIPKNDTRLNYLKQLNEKVEKTMIDPSEDGS